MEQPASAPADQTSQAANGSGGQITLVSAVSIGIGGMVGAGIFSILGVVAEAAGNAMWMSFAIGGMVARVESDGLVTRKSSTTVKSFDGAPGAFRATLSDGGTIDCSAAILAHSSGAAQ